MPSQRVNVLTIQNLTRTRKVGGLISILKLLTVIFLDRGGSTSTPQLGWFVADTLIAKAADTYTFRQRM